MKIYFFHILYIVKPFFKALWEIEARPVALNFQIQWFSVSSILQFQLRSKIDSRKLLRLIIGSYLTELTFLKEMRMFSRNFNHHWSVERKKKFSDCPRKQIFGLDSIQHSSNFISLPFCVSSKHFLNLYGKYKTGQLR